MKTKNTRVRIKDIKQGVTIYTSHPVYGIEKRFLLSKPFKSASGISNFCKQHTEHVFNSDFSLRDAGVTKGESYNYRRSFFKRKHAEEWARKMKNDKGFIKHHQKHLDSMEIFGSFC